MKELSSIRKHPDNPRIYGDKEIRKIAKSITEFPKMMEARPIIVNAEGAILGGHIRYEALLSLGYTEVEDTWIDTFTTEQAERFIVTDNVSYGEWDVPALAATYTKEELKGWGGEHNWNDTDAWKAPPKAKPAPTKSIMLDYTFDDYMALRRMMSEAKVSNAGQILHDALKEVVG